MRAFMSFFLCLQSDFNYFIKLFNQTLSSECTRFIIYNFNFEELK